MPAATPPGFNKNLRDITKVLLSVTSVLLLLGCPGIAVFSATGALWVVNEGTILSFKNFYWSMISIVSVLSSVFSWFLRYSAAGVDAKLAYALKTLLGIMGRGTELICGFMLALCLAHAMATKLKDEPQLFLRKEN
jgi:hypothetical protein